MIIAETPRPRDAAVYHTVPWVTLNATGGGYRMADGGAKPDQSRNAADSMQGKFGVSNITKHLQHSMKLKECGVFDCYNKASTVSSPANAKGCSAVTAAPGFVSTTSSHRVCS